MAGCAVNVILFKIASYSTVVSNFKLCLNCCLSPTGNKDFFTKTIVALFKPSQPVHLYNFNLCIFNKFTLETSRSS